MATFTDDQFRALCLLEDDTDDTGHSKSELKDKLKKSLSHVSERVVAPLESKMIIYRKNTVGQIGERGKRGRPKEPLFIHHSTRNRIRDEAERSLEDVSKDLSETGIESTQFKTCGNRVVNVKFSNGTIRKPTKKELKIINKRELYYNTKMKFSSGPQCRIAKVEAGLVIAVPWSPFFAKTKAKEPTVKRVARASHDEWIALNPVPRNLLDWECPKCEKASLHIALNDDFHVHVSCFGCRYERDISLNASPNEFDENCAMFDKLIAPHHIETYISSAR